jgi:hypothetical protein
MNVSKSDYSLLRLGVGQDIVVGIATRYGLDVPWIEYRWGRNSTHRFRPALGPTLSSV